MPDSPRRVLITGVSRGLGRALAEGLAAAGHTVVGCARHPDPLAALARQLGPPHSVTVVDVSDEEQVAAWAREVLAVGGPPDLLINNAAIINQPAELWRVPAAEFDAVLDVNVKGAVRVIRHFLPAMLEAGRGVVVNFSSGWGRSTSPQMAPYCATKYAIEGLTRALAQELPPPLAAVAFSPGVIDTDMLRIAFGDDAAAHPGPERWSQRAIPFLLGLDRSDNGIPQSL